MVWILDHLDDLDADFLAIYGINEPLDSLSGPRFFKLAYRVSAFNGVMAARIAAQQQEQSESGGVGPQDRPASKGTQGELMALNLSSRKEGEVANLFDYARAPEGG